MSQLVTTLWVVEPRLVVTAEELEAMTPDERVELFRSRVVRDLGEIEPEVRARIGRRARELAQEYGLLESEQQ